MGGDWPRLAREAALELSGGDAEIETSMGTLLLADLCKIFEARDADRLASANICNALAEMEDRPWPEWRMGKPITTRQLASLLKPFDVFPKTIRVGDSTPKGYVLADLDDPFARYVPNSSATPPQPNKDGDNHQIPIHNTGPDVAEGNSRITPDLLDCGGVADETEINGTQPAIVDDINGQDYPLPADRLLPGLRKKGQGRMWEETL